jgi:hypothetical protein
MNELMALSIRGKAAECFANYLLTRVPIPEQCKVSFTFEHYSMFFVARWRFCMNDQEFGSEITFSVSVPDGKFPRGASYQRGMKPAKYNPATPEGLLEDWVLHNVTSFAAQCVLSYSLARGDRGDVRLKRFARAQKKKAS